jgi:hypothetical protein
VPLVIGRMRHDGEHLYGFDGQERGAMPLNGLRVLEPELLRESAWQTIGLDLIYAAGLLSVTMHFPWAVATSLLLSWP